MVYAFAKVIAKKIDDTPYVYVLITYSYSR